MSFSEQLAEILNEVSDQVKTEFFHSGVSPDNDRYDDEEAQEFKKLLLDSGISFKHVDNFGGEGMGEEYWSVYSFSNAQQQLLVKFDGWYASYNGSEYQEWYFVSPQPVMKTEYIKT